MFKILFRDKNCISKKSFTKLDSLHQLSINDCQYFLIVYPCFVLCYYYLFIYFIHLWATHVRWDKIKSLYKIHINLFSIHFKHYSNPCCFHINTFQSNFTQKLIWACGDTQKFNLFICNRHMLLFNEY